MGEKKVGKDRLRPICAVMTIAMTLLLVPAATSQAEQPAYTVQYGPLERDYAVVHPAPGGVPLLLLHEAGFTTKSTETMAFNIQREKLFTVINLEWEEFKGRGIWEYDVGQVEEAVRYVQLHAEGLGVDAGRLEMLGGSRGANLSLLTSLDMNAASPGTVKAIVALSGDANPMNQIARAEAGELASGIAGKLSRVYDCEPVLVSCPVPYIETWSPFAKAAASAPAMFLAASEAEKRTASLPDEGELAAKVGEFGIPAEVFAPASGHGFEYWKSAHPLALAFLTAQQGS